MDTFEKRAFYYLNVGVDDHDSQENFFFLLFSLLYLEDDVRVAKMGMERDLKVLFLSFCKKEIYRGGVTK